MSSPYESSWFNILRAEGAVTSTSPGTKALFNVRYSPKKRKKDDEEDSEEKKNKSQSTRRHGDLL